MRKTALIAALALAFSGAPVAFQSAHAQGISLAFPLDCTLGEDCFIQQFADRDPGPGALDYACGPLSYDGHRGVDFALPDLAAMRRGVFVRAAAGGTVRGQRDGVPDIALGDPAAPPLNGRDCGNGVAITHPGGWETQYCHMAEGSIRHKAGDRVAAGEILGKVGLSGRTQFPHLHLVVRRNGKVIDPFDPDGAQECGPGPLEQLWAEPIPYQAGGFFALGLSSGVPRWAGIQEGLEQGALTPSAPVLVIWAAYFGNRAGDVLKLRITAPDGSTLHQSAATLESAKAQAFRAARTRRQGSAGWPQGLYELEAVLLRGGQEIDRRVARVPLR